jgi:hypothetical protein
LKMDPYTYSISITFGEFRLFGMYTFKGRWGPLGPPFKDGSLNKYKTTTSQTDREREAERGRSSLLVHPDFSVPLTWICLVIEGTGAFRPPLDDCTSLYKDLADTEDERQHQEASSERIASVYAFGSPD